MALQIYNVLHREKEPFEPMHEGKVNMYVCGPTVYDHAHIGHAKTYLSFDIVVRYLRYRGYDVLYVQNLTDVGHLLDSGEDRILKKARQSQSLPMQIVSRRRGCGVSVGVDTAVITTPAASVLAGACVWRIGALHELLKSKKNNPRSGNNVFLMAEGI